MKTIILSLAIATSSYTHSTTHQLTSAQVYAQIEAINNAAAQEALSTGYAHPWVTPPEMFEATTPVSQETYIEQPLNPILSCSNPYAPWPNRPGINCLDN